MSHQQLRKESVSPKIVIGRRTGSAGDPICPSASGQRCAKIIRPMVTAGIISPMIMLEAGSIAGAKTDCWDSPTASADGSRYFDVQIEYAKAGPDDLLIRI